MKRNRSYQNMRMNCVPVVYHFFFLFFHFMCIFLFCGDISITVSTYNVTANL